MDRGVAGGRRDVRRRSGAGLGVAHGERDLGSRAGERSRGLHADARRAAGDDRAPAGQVDSLGHLGGGRVGAEGRGDRGAPASIACGPRLTASPRAGPSSARPASSLSPSGWSMNDRATSHQQQRPASRHLPPPIIHQRLALPSRPRGAVSRRAAAVSARAPAGSPYSAHSMVYAYACPMRRRSGYSPRRRRWAPATSGSTSRCTRCSRTMAPPGLPRLERSGRGGGALAPLRRSRSTAILIGVPAFISACDNKRAADLRHRRRRGLRALRRRGRGAHARRHRPLRDHQRARLERDVPGHPPGLRAHARLRLRRHQGALPGQPRATRWCVGHHREGLADARVRHPGSGGRDQVRHRERARARRARLAHQRS